MSIYYAIVSTFVFMLENFYNRESKMYVIFKKQKVVVCEQIYHSCSYSLLVVLTSCHSPCNHKICITRNGWVGQKYWKLYFKLIDRRSVIFNMISECPWLLGKVWFTKEWTFHFLAKDINVRQQVNRWYLVLSSSFKVNCIDRDINAKTRQFLPITLCFLVEFFC